jgi:hypothetical protein
VQRAVDRLPRRGSTGPWRLTNNYPRDLLVLRWGRIAGRHLRFSPGPGCRESHVHDVSRPEPGFQDNTQGVA